ncbi:MAG: RNA ligase (ATP) [Bacteroidetes bacterium]|nr:MAG: RNA ligase (ATP) [Bacteroidota bacterium]TAG89467.1 MAG: RNA ligase (ATP) [Bacteroidota bacterium]
MRKLASIQKIKSLSDIPEADNIQKATVLGWELVVKKNEFEVGDFCVYCEIDSVMPDDNPAFEFLRNKNFRIKTIRLRGQVSQGICLPVSILPQEIEIVEDKEVTEILGITKYDPPMPASLAGEMEGYFPTFIPKTDETRVQVLQELLDKYVGQIFYVTEKLDGTSVTYFIQDGEFGVCSRNYQIKESNTNTFWQVAHTLGIEQKLRALGGNWALQGELVGENIQKNKYKLKGQQVFLFNIFNSDKFDYLDFEDFLAMAKKLEMKTVPILETDYVLENNIRDLVEKSIGDSVLIKNVKREGIVLRPLQEKTERTYGRVSFKAINPEFLLKYD